VKILFVGDISGRPGRMAAAHFLPLLTQELGVNMIIANGENAAGGIGLTAPVFEEILAAGVSIVTSGNHVWDKKEIFAFIDRADKLIRPANYPPGTPGRGYQTVDVNGTVVGVVNLSGRVYMPPVDCPFQTIDKILNEIGERCDFVVVDFHAEASSEKMALGWYLDGRVAAVIGTHTHIQTADERILPGGTAYITDLGMVGPWNSVLGVDKDLVIKKFVTGLPAKFQLAEGVVVFNAALVEVDELSGKALNIMRIQRFK